MHTNSAPTSRRPSGRSPQPGEIAEQSLYRKIGSLLERLLFSGNPEQDFSDAVAASLNISPAKSERLCNLYLRSMARQYRTLRLNVEWALRDSSELGQQMYQEAREERVA